MSQPSLEVDTYSLKANEASATIEEFTLSIGSLIYTSAYVITAPAFNFTSAGAFSITTVSQITHASANIHLISDGDFSASGDHIELTATNNMLLTAGSFNIVSSTPPLANAKPIINSHDWTYTDLTFSAVIPAVLAGTIQQLLTKDGQRVRFIITFNLNANGVAAANDRILFSLNCPAQFRPAQLLQFSLVAAVDHAGLSTQPFNFILDTNGQMWLGSYAYSAGDHLYFNALVISGTYHL